MVINLPIGINFDLLLFEDFPYLTHNSSVSSITPKWARSILPLRFARIVNGVLGSPIFYGFYSEDHKIRGTKP